MKTAKRALIDASPVMVGYLFVGIAFGLLLFSAGYSWVWALAISSIVYAGSMQFVLVPFLTAGTGLLTVAITTLTVNCRHMFYGLSFIEKFKTMGRLRPYMIFSLTDETYSLFCLAENRGENEKRYSFYIAAFNQFSWIGGSVIGGILGQTIPFDGTGIDFAMTALFVVIFIEQWISAGSRIPAVTGLLSGIICLLIFGPDKFILPALILAVSVLMALKKRIGGSV